MSNLLGLMLLTSEHACHDDRWIFNCGHQGIVFCMACALEQLEDPEKPSVKKKFLLTEMLKVVVDDEQDLLQCLAFEEQVSVHLVNVLIGLFSTSDEGIIASAIEVIVQVCCQLRSEDLVCGLVDQVTSQCLHDSTFQYSLPSLTLIGRLLQSIPPLNDLLQDSYRGFTEYLLTGFKYPDESIQSAVTYILLHLASGNIANICKEPLVKELVKNLLTVISSAISPELIMNLLGLFKKVVENESSVHQVMAADYYSLVSSAFKKVLLSRNDVHQITVVQCLTQLVMAEQQQNQRAFTEALLSADIAEFLYECLATSNDILLSSIFCCLLVLTNSDDFFQECHAVYGIESVVRATNHAVKLKNKDILCQGLDLLRKMLKRQPMNISLITSSSLLKSLSSLLCRCLSHSHINVFCCGCCVFNELLRKDHLKSPVDFSVLEKPLNAIMETWKEHGPLQSSQTKNSKSTTSTLTSEQNKQFDENKKYMAVGLEVISSAFRLCIQCHQDPTTSAILYAAPNVQEITDEETVDVEQFTQFLLKMLDTVCIPHVMVNYKCLNDTEVCKFFFSILSQVYDLSTPDIKSFSTKLVSSSFVQLSLRMKSQFCSQQADTGVREQVDSFLLKLCENLLPEEDMLCLDKMKSVLKDINCPASDICSLIRGQSSRFFLPSSVSFLDVQSTCLALMYITSLYGDPLGNDKEVFESLYINLSNVNCLMCDLDPTSIKHLMFLYTTCYNNATLEDTPSSLIQVLGKTDLSTIYSDQASFIHWAYSVPDLPQDIRRGIFVQWLQHLPCTQTPENSCKEHNSSNEKDYTNSMELEGEESIWGTDAESIWDTDWENDWNVDESKGIPNIEVDKVELLSKSMPHFDNPVSKSRLMEDLLDIFINGDETLMNRCLLLIKASIKFNDYLNSETTSQTQSNAVALLQERIPQMVLEMFRKDPVEPITEMKIATILKLLTEINLRALDTLCHVDLKLVYYVTNLLTKSISSTETRLAVINFLHCLLFAKKEDTSVLSVLLSNKTLLQLLESLLKERKRGVENKRLQCSVLSLIATLIKLQKEYQMKPCVTITVDTMWLIDFVSISKPSFQRYTAMNVWTTIFDTEVSSDNILQLSEDSTERELLQDQDVNLDIKTDHLRLLIVHLQNLIMMDSGSESLLGVTCYTSLMKYVHKKDHTQGEILVKKSWNGALVRLLLQVQTPSFISPTLIQLYSLLMYYKFWIEILLVGFIELVTGIKSWSQLSVISYHTLLNIVNKISGYIPNDQKVCLQNILEDSKKHLDEMRKDTSTNKLVVINDVILQSGPLTSATETWLSNLDLVMKKLNADESNT